MKVVKKLMALVLACSPAAAEAVVAAVPFPTVTEE